jgi:hypothetical protein
MIVRIQNKGRSVTGLRIGASNVRRYFRSELDAIDLELDHLRIRCQLKAGFWNDQPEISDSRLCAWLQNKCEKLPGTPGSPEMVREDDSYRLDLPRSMRPTTT